MNNQFDELTKGVAQSVTRRGALKKFGLGLAGMALACFGLANKSEAAKGRRCASDADCRSGEVCCDGVCVAGIPDWCDPATCCCHCVGPRRNRYYTTALPPCHPDYWFCDAACGAVIGAC